MIPPPDQRRDPREDLRLPMMLVAIMLGFALLALIFLNAPRVALAVVILAIVILLAILRAILFSGDH
jgi:hypothetical protein